MKHHKWWAVVVLWAMVPGSVVVDSLVGLLGQAGDGAGLTGSAAQLFRGGWLLVGVSALVVFPRFARLRLFVFVLLTLGVAGLTVGVAGGTSDIGFDVLQLSRILFGPLAVVGWAAVFWLGGVSADAVVRSVCAYGALAGLLLGGLWLAGVGLPTFGDYSSGVAGFFYAPNDAGVAMLLSLAASTSLFVRRRRLWALVAAGLTVFGLALLGTRAGLIGSALVPGMVLVLERRSILRASASSLLIVGLLGAGLAAAMTFQAARLSADPYMAGRLAALAAGDLGRVRLARRALTSWVESPPLHVMVGGGAATYRWPGAGPRNPDTDLLAEVDWVDVLGSHGLLMVILLHGFYIAFWFWRRGSADLLESAAASALAIGLLVYLGHASVAGHAVSSPMASGVLAPLMAIVIVERRRRRLLLD